MNKVIERHLHEHADERKQRRDVLYMTGHGCRIDLKEDDIKGNWCIDSWIYRPPPAYTAKTRYVYK